MCAEAKANTALVEVQVGYYGKKDMSPSQLACSHWNRIEQLTCFVHAVAFKNRDPYTDRYFFRPSRRVLSLAFGVEPEYGTTPIVSFPALSLWSGIDNRSTRWEVSETQGCDPRPLFVDSDKWGYVAAGGVYDNNWTAYAVEMPGHPILKYMGLANGGGTTIQAVCEGMGLSLPAEYFLDRLDVTSVGLDTYVAGRSVDLYRRHSLDL